MTSIGIIGDGSFGTALACVTRRSGHDVLAERKEVTEGAFSVKAVAALARQLHVDIPITLALDELLNHGRALDDVMAQIMRQLPPLWHAG